jgi:hypothetical protein
MYGAPREACRGRTNEEPEGGRGWAPPCRICAESRVHFCPLVSPPVHLQRPGSTTETAQILPCRDHPRRGFLIHWSGVRIPPGVPTQRPCLPPSGIRAETRSAGRRGASDRGPEQGWPPLAASSGVTVRDRWQPPVAAGRHPGERSPRLGRTRSSHARQTGLRRREGANRPRRVAMGRA